MNKRRTKVWYQCIVDKNSPKDTIDFTGVHLNFNNKDWDVDHICPINNIYDNKYGSNSYKNLQVCSISINNLKANNKNMKIYNNYNDGLNVITDFEVRKNIFYNISNVGIIYIKSQTNNYNNYKINNLYFYHGYGFKFNKKHDLLCYKIDLIKSIIKSQIVLGNIITVCKKQNNKWLFPF